MMNIIAISLVATSLLVSGLFSPNPQTNNGGEQVIVREGHRAVVVEYEDATGDGNTKVSISPEHLSHAAASVAGVAQDVKETGTGTGPRELICDVYGKCKHKIADAWGKTKEKVGDAEEEMRESVTGVAEKVKEMGSKAGEKAGDVRRGAESKVRETGEKVKETGEQVKGKAEYAAGKTGEMAAKAKEKTGEVVEEAAEKIKEKGRKGKEELSDIARRGKDVICDVFGFVFGLVPIGSLMRMMHLLGFAMAYGISVWVTFIMSHVLAGVLPRQQFGMVQSKIYPVYFKAMLGSIGLALLGHLLGERGNLFKSKAGMFQGYNLLSSLLLVLANLRYLEPQATKIMFQRLKLEKEEGRGRDNHAHAPTRVVDTVVTEDAGPVTTASATTTVPTVTSPLTQREQDEVKSKLRNLDNRLKKLNSYSSLLNIGTLMGLTGHLVYLSQRLAAHS